MTEVEAGGEQRDYDFSLGYVATGAGASAPILAGETELTAQVQVVWELR